MSIFNFAKPVFTKRIFVNPGGSVALGLVNHELHIAGLPVKGSTTGETFDLAFCSRSIGLRLTVDGNFAVKFPEVPRTKPMTDANGHPVLDPTTGKPRREVVLKANGDVQYDASFFPITKVTREAMNAYFAAIPGVAEAIVEARNELAEAIARGEVNASASTPAPSTGAPAAELQEFSL